MQNGGVCLVSALSVFDHVPRTMRGTWLVMLNQTHAKVRVFGIGFDRVRSRSAYYAWNVVSHAIFYERVRS